MKPTSTHVVVALVVGAFIGHYIGKR